jgi:hypothetical protein
MTETTTTSKIDEALLVKSLNDFTTWLYQRKILKEDITIKHKVDFPYADDDWLMKVNGNEVSFNTFVIERCSYNYYIATMLHESFHLMVQKVPNKIDATRIKDGFGGELMKLIDIEADFYTALYYKEKLNFSLVDYLGIYYDGRTVFNDERIRTVKFERFIGSILSIVNMFISFPKNEKIALEFDLYLPSISQVYTEDILPLLVLRKEHIYFDEIKASHEDFVSLKVCYANIDSLTKQEYIKRLIEFTFRAFNKKITKTIQNEISKIPK